ncbi:hypothetical protein LTR17_026522 [Elasticomyces elasticus]|nr:hypothetical protein LTR17_026522 [Elasticomyces elasticus]
MPNRLSKVFSRSEAEKHKEAEAEVENNRSSGSTPPPSYAPPDYDAGNTLDPPDITAGFSNLRLNVKNKDSFPSTYETIAHLKLLEAFYRLRQQVGSKDGLFGINDSVVTSHIPSGDKASELLAKLAEKRWAIYLTRAVERFDAWLHALLPKAKVTPISQYDSPIKRGLVCEPTRADSPLAFENTNMPPIDVLMVWHAYMLNPRAYLEDCLRFGRMSLWHTNMPWGIAAACIDSETFAYQPGQAAEELFISRVNLPWDNIADNREKTVFCPSCKAPSPVPWTTASTYDFGEKVTESNVWAAVDIMLSSGTGYCDKDFEHICSSCSKKVTHPRLQAAKFCADVDQLLYNGVNMSGTWLSLDGWPPGGVLGAKNTQMKETRHKLLTDFPNNLLLSGLGKIIIDKGQIRGVRANDSMEGIRDIIEEAMLDKSYKRKARKSMSSTLLRGEKIGVRRMMSRYWDNSSPFALDLVGAVVRQGSFIEKMHNIDWLHSPALPSTMGRLLTKYARFVSIMADQQHMAVPTLDVDLAWHTHQLSPYGYMGYTVVHTTQFVDHDDKVAETKLNDAFAWTSKTYQRLYSEPYSECTCWYCEAVRESHTSAASRLFNGAQARAQADLAAQLHKVDINPAKSVHISAHNAVRPSDDDKYKLQAAKQADELDRAYNKACARAKKNGKKEPKREDYYYSDAWGYPVYIPAYSPYVGYVPYTPMYYPVMPGCMAIGAGAIGNCCSGTCGGGVAAGSLEVPAVDAEVEEEVVVDVVAEEVEEAEDVEVEVEVEEDVRVSPLLTKRRMPGSSPTT